MQKFALKLVSRRWDCGYDELLDLVGIPTLCERRLHLKLAQVFKIIHSLCYFPDDIFQMQSSYSSRLERTDTIRCTFAQTNYFFQSPYWSIFNSNPCRTTQICKFGSDNFLCVSNSLQIQILVANIFPKYCYWQNNHITKMLSDHLYVFRHCPRMCLLDY